MEGLAVMGFVFGLVAFVRVEKHIKTLRTKEDQATSKPHLL